MPSFHYFMKALAIRAVADLVSRWTLFRLLVHHCLAFKIGLV